jgi:hypothetical protein
VTGEAQILPDTLDLLIPALFYERTSAGRKRLREAADGWNLHATPVTCALPARPEEI